MAENLDPENIERVNENIQNLESNLEKINESMAQMAALMPIFAKQVGSSNLALDKKIKLEREAGESLEDYTERVEKAIEAEEKKTAELKKSKEKQELYTKGLLGSVNALNSFGTALLSTEKGMSKYSSSLDSLGDTVLDVGKNFGPLGLAIGVATKALTTMASAVLKQNDNIVKSFDSLAKMGGAVGLTSTEIYKLGQEAKFSSDTLDIFVKNAKDAGSNLIALGGSVSGGVKAYKDFVSVGDDALRQYRRLGITQEELIEAQTIYMRQQIQSGNQLRRSPEELQKASLKYIDNLNVLSELTGISIQEQQKALDIANANANFNAYKFSMEQKAFELEMQAENELDPVRKARLQAEADQTREIIKNKDEFARMAVATMDAENAAAVLASISTNNTAVLTEQNAHLEMAGMNIVKMSQELNKGSNQTAQLLGNQAKAAERFTKTFGEAAYALGPASQELQKTFGVDNKLRMTATQFAQMKSDEEQKAFIAERLAAEQKLEAAKKGEEAEGRSKDTLMNTVAAQESIEREARIVKDKLLEAINPFISGTKDAAITAGALAVAAGLAAAKLSQLAASRFGGAAGAEYAKRGAGALSGGTNLARNVGIGAGALAVGAGALQAYQGRKEADKALEAGEITEEEAKQQKTQATYAGTGSAVGGVAGAALGSLVGPLGTMVGGYLGAQLGETVGNWLASRKNEKDESETGSTTETSRAESPAQRKIRERREAQNQQSTPEQPPIPLEENYAGERAKGGLIPKGKFALVGEEGPEFVSGPASVTNQEQFSENLLKKIEQKTKISAFSSIKDNFKIPSINENKISKKISLESNNEKEFDKTTEDFIDTFFESDKVVKSFNKDLDSFVKNDPTGKMTKQIELVTSALEDLNQLIDPNLSTLDINTGRNVKAPSPTGIVSAVLQGLSGIFSGGGISAAGGTTGKSASFSSATSSSSEPRPRSNNFVNTITSAFGFGESASTGFDLGDTTRTASTDTNILEPPKARARTAPTGQMSEEDIKHMIIRHEGVRYRPYKDSLGLWTVGIGHLIGDGKTLPPSWNREFSREEVLDLFEKDYNHHRKAAERIPGFDKLNSLGQGALTDLTFNMGPHWINKWPNTKNKLSEGDVQSAAENLEKSKWYTQVGNRAPTIVSMLENGIQAKEGGLVAGPETGYPATLHGNEVIVPLDSNSVLEKLAKTPATPIPTPTEQITKIEAPVLNDSMKELNATNLQMMEMLSEKLDEMINKLDSSVDIQDRILKYNSA